MAIIFLLMGTHMMEIGQMVKQMDKVNLYLKMEIYMKENLKTTLFLVKEVLLWKMVIFILEYLLMA